MRIEDFNIDLNDDDKAVLAEIKREEISLGNYSDLLWFSISPITHFPSLFFFPFLSKFDVSSDY